MILFIIIKIKLNIIFIIFLIYYFEINSNYLYSKIIKTILKYFKNLKNKDIIYYNKSKLKIENYLNFNEIKKKNIKN